MEFDSVTHSIGMAGQVFFLDLLLSGDNALVIALACRSLPRPLMARAIMLGTGFAIVLRVLLTTLASFILQIPLLKLVGAVLLLSIAIKLLLPDADHQREMHSQHSVRTNQLGAAVMLIVTTDLVLSLDNVVALAAAAQGSVLFLILGLLLSVPILMYGSLFITRLLEEFPLLVPAGSALLGWIAGQIAVTDPLVASWVDTQAPALSVVIPMLCVVFVLYESRIIREQQPGLTAPPPLRLFSSITQAFSRLGEAKLPETVLHQVEAHVAPAAVAETLAPQVAAPNVSLPVEPVVVSTPAEEESQPSAAPIEAGPPPDDEETRDQAETALLKILIWIAIGIGALGLGWIVVHLMSQGFMPTPARQPQVMPLLK